MAKPSNKFLSVCLLFVLASAGVQAAPVEDCGQPLAAAVRASRLVPLVDAPESDVVNLTPVASSNALNVAITVTGAIRANLVWPFGTIHIPVQSASSKTAWLGGVQPMRIEAVFDPTNHAGHVVGLEAVKGDICVSNTLLFTLDLGRYYGIGLGRVDVTATNLGGRIETPRPQSLNRGTCDAFPVNQHLLTLSQGVLKGSASGLASERLKPFTLVLSATPMRGQLGSSSGTAVLTETAMACATNCYRVTLTTPVDFTCPIAIKAPVKVFAKITGTTLWQGEFQRH